MRVRFAYEDLGNFATKIVICKDERGYYVVKCYPESCSDEDDVVYYMLDNFLDHTDLVIE